ncbi:MAG: tandem-95 repeat protein, partial [Pedobacter sp.]
NGTVAVNASGEVLYTPDATFSGKDSFKYILRTADGYESDPITVTVTVKPVGTSDLQNYTLNTQLNINVKDNDLSKSNTIVVINTNPANGTVTVNSSGVVTYTPNTGFAGTNTFTYLLRTADGTDSDPITVTVTPTATTPTGSPDIANTTTNTSVTIPVKNNDASQTGTTVIIASNPTNGTVTLNGSGVPVYTPTTGFSGKDTFTYKLRNGGGIESDPITVTVNVKPVGTNNEVTTPAATAINIAVKDNDLSKTGTTVIITNSPANGTISVNAANEVLYTPSSTFSGKDNLTYLLRTADGLESDPINVVINVKPVGSPDNEGYNLNTPKAITVKDNDLSKANTTVVITSSPANGTLAVNGTGIITYTPTTGFNGTNTFTYILRTADGLDSDPITVTVTPITPQPTGTPDIANTTTNTPITIPVKDNDVSKLGTTVIIQDNPINGTVVINGTGDPVYTPANGFSGKDTFTYKLRNTSGGLESDPITVTVNVRPSGSPDNGIFSINTPLNIDVKNNDLSKANTTVIINSNPANGSVTVNGSNVTYTPNTGYVGNDVFTYVLRTADGLNSDPINVTVSAVPLPVRPSGSPDIATTPTNIPVTIAIKDNDASKTGTTAAIQTTPTHGTVTVNPAGEAIYTPTPGFSGKDTFTYVLTDNNGLTSDPISVTVNVKPVGTNDNASTPVNKPVTINIKNNDLSKVGTTPIINTNPEHGTVTIDAGGNAIYTPTNGYIGTDSFTYRLKTADNVESDPIVVIITVTPASQVPDITVNVPTDKPIVVDVVIPPGGSVVITNPPKHGTITIDPVTGKPIYTPNPGYTGPDDFTYIIKDGDGNESGPGKVNITVVKPAKIGLAKALVSSIKGENNSFKLTYIFTLKNYGDAAINQLSLIDNLAAAFPARIFTISKLTGSGTLRVNPGFNGGTSTEMLLASSTLNANSSETVELEVTLTVNQQSGTFLNTATVVGRSVGDGTAISDISTSGLIPDPVTPGDVSPSTPTQAVILIAPNINVPVSSGQPITINIPLPPGGSIVIVNPPANGTITFDPVTGLPIYTPNLGYSGPDDFTYIIKDPNGNESLPGTVNITVTTPAKIGLAKALIGNIKNIDGSFNLTYQFTLVNYGDFTIENLSLTDKAKAFIAGASFEIVNISTTGNLKVNTQYNGRTNLNMLLPTSTLEAKTKEFVEMQLRIVLDKDRATFNNFAVAEGASANNGGITTDQSTNGFNPDPDVPGNVTPSVLTPVTLTKELLKIPGGFSPNNDGINDFFVIENSQGKKINLEIYNRWGNRVYRSKEYQNTWNGRSNEGIRIGEDLPVGTYYYIIQIAGENKRVGYITINR